ncbi:ABC transporter substrate-binding protein [Winogradskyella tangerina]|uniref:ABC transporter substrate-binding protein n=1 Tax=Winogradskyella tangerina TaxID=2023240 RepID=UPI000DBE7627|nr:helical backbone metal receptor [Winogradskyella tangerina]
MIYKDQLNREIRLKGTPKRIISIVPSQTELLVDLGIEQALVGITKFCIHPHQLRKEKSIVGGTKQVHLDKIKALEPDIILCNKEENTKEMIEALESIAPVHVSDIDSLEDCYDLIYSYGELFKVTSKALEMISNIQNERERFQAKITKGLWPKVAYFIWKKPWMVVGSNTFINTMLKEAGFLNVFEHETRYPEIQLDHSCLKEASHIFLSSEPYPFKSQHVEELRNHFPNKTIEIVDGEMFSWYGSRLQKAFQYFESIHSK